MYKIVKSLFHVALIAICVSVPVAASAGVGTEPSVMTPSDLTNSTVPLMTAPSPDVQVAADSRAIAPSAPAPSFKADMLLAQGFDSYAGNVSPSYVDTSNMMTPQQYTSSQYPMPLDMGQSSQYSGSMTVPPYPYQGNQPYVQGTAPDAMMPYDPQGMYSQVPQQMQQGMYPQMQQQSMYPQMQQQAMYPQMQQQGMYPQMSQGMEMSPYGMQQQYMSVEQLYNQARQAYNTRDYQGAMMGFQELAMRFPQSDLADNAHYWMGEIYYNSKNYPAAIQSFQTVIQMYPQGNKVPDAMVKMGFAYAEIRQYNIARSILNDVSMRFSDNARIRNLAVKKLNSLNNLY